MSDHDESAAAAQAAIAAIAAPQPDAFGFAIVLLRAAVDPKATQIVVADLKAQADALKAGQTKLEDDRALLEGARTKYKNELLAEAKKQEDKIGTLWKLLREHQEKWTSRLERVEKFVSDEQQRGSSRIFEDLPGGGRRVIDRSEWNAMHREAKFGDGPLPEPEVGNPRESWGGQKFPDHVTVTRNVVPPPAPAPAVVTQEVPLGRAPRQRSLRRG